MENHLNNSDSLNECVEEFVENEEQIALDIFHVKKGTGFNESNLMSIPFISLKRSKETKIFRQWLKDDGEEVILKTECSEYGVPKIDDFDTLLALFRIHLKNNDFKFTKLSDKTIDIPKKINFTFYELCLELGLSPCGDTFKRLRERIKRLKSTNIETQSIARKINNKGEYKLEKEFGFNIIDEFSFKDKKSFRINNEDYDPTKIKEDQYISMSDFVVKNICGGYFKLYNEDEYKMLKGVFGKRLYTILSSWSKSGEKFLSYDVLMNYIGFSEEEKTEKRKESIRKIKKGFDELKSIGFIDDYEPIKGKGINIIYDRKYVRNITQMDKYINEGEILAWFRGITINGTSIFEYSEILDILKKNDFEYLQGFARYIDFKLRKNNKISKLKEYILNGLNYDNVINEKYNITKFMS